MPREQETNLRTYPEWMSRQLPVDDTTTQLACKRWEASSEQMLARRHSIGDPRKHDAQRRRTLGTKPRPQTGHRFWAVRTEKMKTNKRRSSETREWKEDVRITGIFMPIWTNIARKKYCGTNVPKREGEINKFGRRTKTGAKTRRPSHCGNHFINRRSVHAVLERLAKRFWMR
jgi:hypothetical protein